MSLGLLNAGEATTAIPMLAKGKGLADRVKDIVITALLTTIVVAGCMYNFSRGELRDTQNLIKALTVPTVATASVVPETTTTLPKP